MNPETLLEILIKERDYHASHPHEVAVKFIYGLGTSLASLVAAIYFTDISNTQLKELFQSRSLVITIILFVAGLVVVSIGMAEHAYLHKQQRLRLENAISYILGKGSKFDYDEFWQEYQSSILCYRGKKQQKRPTSLISLEPDTRGYLSFHDRKIEAGAIIIFIAFLIIICQALVL